MNNVNQRLDVNTNTSIIHLTIKDQTATVETNISAILYLESRERTEKTEGLLMSVDVDKKLIFPQCIATTTLRPDIVLWSQSSRQVAMVELTVPWVERTEEAHQWQWMESMGTTSRNWLSRIPSSERME